MRTATATATAFVLVACGSTQPPPENHDPRALAADLPEMEIRADGIDRFTTCPPPGELGQHWIPALPPWAPTGQADAGVVDPFDPSYVHRTGEQTTTEIAAEKTRRDFRACYRQGLVHHPNQDGRIAIVLRIDGGGNVAKVESYGACELAPESISCMVDAAKRLRFSPPAGGQDTVTLPATFTSRDGVRRTVPTINDSYTAAAYVILDAARAQLHVCESTAHKEGRPVMATGTFSMDIAIDGHVTKAFVDPWTGDQSLLQCAAHVLERLKFPPPDSDSGGVTKVIARLNFNPRQGSR
jgi:hypothetical protein